MLKQAHDLITDLELVVFLLLHPLYYLCLSLNLLVNQSGFLLFRLAYFLDIFLRILLQFDIDLDSWLHLLCLFLLFLLSDSDFKLSQRHSLVLIHECSDFQHLAERDTPHLISLVNGHLLA